MDDKIETLKKQNEILKQEIINKLNGALGFTGNMGISGLDEIIDGIVQLSVAEVAIVQREALHKIRGQNNEER